MANPHTPPSGIPPILAPEVRHVRTYSLKRRVLLFLLIAALVAVASLWGMVFLRQFLGSLSNFGGY